MRQDAILAGVWITRRPADTLFDIDCERSFFGVEVMLLRTMLLLSLVAGLVLVRTSFADETPAATDEAETPVAKGFDAPEGGVRLTPKHDVWIDAKKKQVIVDGTVCLREGQLEMFACPRGTKEHESILALKTKASYVHAGLLAIGAKAGNVVKFSPEYAPAHGDTIFIEVQWRDADGKLQKVKAQKWIKHVKTEKEMPYDWVFAGSGFWVDQTDGVRHYQADAGDFICVSNFPTATLDLPVESSQANAGLLFRAFTERIPPLKTPVRLVLTYKSNPAPKKAPAKEKPAEEAAEKP